MIADRSGKRLYLNADERHAFLKAATRQPGEVRSFCETLHYTGCRISEALNLTVGQVDLDDSTITFQTLKKRRPGVYRTVPIPSQLVTTLELVHRIRASRRANRPLWSWCRVTGWRYVKSVMDEAGIRPGPQMTAKGLRHAYGVNAISNGVPLNLLSRWMGHSAIEITAIYANAVGPEQRQLAEKMWQ
jgi:integrase/recombinase XerD